MSGSRRSIVAIGGGGFLYGDRFADLDEIALELTGKERPAVCFLPTAGGDHPDFIQRFYSAFDGVAALSHVTLFIRQGTQAAPAEHLLKQDLIYVSSGNSVACLAVWREMGIDVALRRAHDQGIVLTGVSAGAACWFEWSVTDARGHGTRRETGLGLLPGGIAAHCNVLPERALALRGHVAGGSDGDFGIALDDGLALVYDGAVLVGARSCRPDARAVRITAGEPDVTIATTDASREGLPQRGVQLDSPAT